MNKAAKVFTMFAAAAVLTGNVYFPVSVYADEVVVYDAAKFDTFKDRTPQQVSAEYSKYRYAAQSYDDGVVSTYYTTPASVSAPYAAGVLTADTHKAMTDMTNFHRWLSGANPLKNVSANDDKLQAEALMRNFEFNHYISDSSKPADMSQELWDYGKTCTHNIIAWNYTPQGSVTGWLNEGYTESGGWDVLGHRHALISPEISAVTFGYSGVIGMGRIDGRDNECREAFSAYPAPGYVPRDLISAVETAWGVYIDTSKLSIPSDTSAVKVTVKNLNTGKTFERSGGNVLVSSNSVSFVQPNDYTTEFFSTYYTDSYSVEITGLREAGTGKSAKLLYTVNFFDPTNLMSGYVDYVDIVKNNYIIYKDIATTEFLQKVAAILPKTVDGYAQNGRKFELTVEDGWVLDSANSRFTAQIDKSSLPADITDRNNVLGTVEIKYTVSDSEFDSYNSIEIPKTVEAGSTEQIKIYRTWVQTDRSEVFRLVANGDGTYGFSEHLDSFTSSEFDEEQSALESNFPYHIYNKQFGRADSGEYIAVFYSTNELFHDVYVTNGTATVEVPRGDEKSLIGDVDDNGQINSEDALHALRLSLGYSGAGLNAKFADVDNDGIITSADALFILRYSVGLKDNGAHVGEEAY